MGMVSTPASVGERDAWEPMAQDAPDRLRTYSPLLASLLPVEGTDVPGVPATPRVLDALDAVTRELLQRAGDWQAQARMAREPEVEDDLLPIPVAPGTMDTLDAMDPLETDGLHAYLRDIRAGAQSYYRPLTTTELLVLALRTRTGDARARARLIEGHLLLVVAVAHRWWRPWLSLLDLIQEGNLGLLRAVAKFDANRGNRLSTYAVPWISRYIRAEVDAQTLPGMPYAANLTLQALRARRRALQLELERPLTLAEVADILHARAAPAPRSVRAWPSASVVADWLACASHVSLARALRVDAGSTTRATSILTLADTLADPTDAYAAIDAAIDDGLDADGLRTSAYMLGDDVVTVQHAGLLTREQALLIVLRYGISCPTLVGERWVPPAGWRLGATQTFRWLAGATGRARSTLQRRVHSAQVRLATAPHPAATRLIHALVQQEADDPVPKPVSLPGS